MKKWILSLAIVMMGLAVKANPLPVKKTYVDAVITYVDTHSEVFDGIAWVTWIEFGHTQINQTYALHFTYRYQINGVGPEYQAPWKISYVHTYDGDWDYVEIIDSGDSDGPVKVPIQGTVEYRFGPFSD